MNKKPTLLIFLLSLVAAYLVGSTVAKIRFEKGVLINKPAKQITPSVAPVPTYPPFVPKTKSAKPEIKFFVMSFCPYGNQAEAGIEPVYQLLKNKVFWQPQYIFGKITQESVDQCKQNCPSRVGDDKAKAQCQDAIDKKQVTGMDADACVKQYFPYKTADECIKTQCSILKVGTYDSLHGQQELNQDVREICAYNLGDLDKWWKFVTAVNSKCNSNDVDKCWAEQAKIAELDVNKITACEKSQKTVLIEKELAEAKKFSATGSPTVLINETLYNGGRSPEDYKKAICASFENPPEECSTVLGQESAGTSGGCN